MPVRDRRTLQRKPSLTLVLIEPKASKMASETMGEISHHDTRGTETSRGIHEQRHDSKRRPSNLFITIIIELVPF